MQGHYHHVIGPAMLEHSDLLVELGRTEAAAGSYDCVISDFSWLLDEYDGSDDAVIDEDSVSLESLHRALSRRLEIGGLAEDAAVQLQRSRERAERILSST